MYRRFGPRACKILEIKSLDEDSTVSEDANERDDKQWDDPLAYLSSEGLRGAALQTSVEDERRLNRLWTGNHLRELKKQEEERMDNRKKGRPPV